MIDIYKERNLFKLWLASFDVSNKMVVPFLKICFVAFLPLVIAKLLSIFLASHAGASLTSILGVSALRLVATVVSLLGYCALIRLTAAHVEGRLETITQAFLSSLLPFVYLLICFLLISGAIFLFSVFFIRILFSAAGASSFLLLIISLLLFFFVVRLFYVPAAIVLKEKGPFSAVQHSWELTEGLEALYSFGAIVLQSLLFGLPGVLIVLILTLVPLLAPSFNLAGLPTPILISLLIIFLCICFFCQACGYVFYTLVFLHVDNEGSSSPWATTPDMHVVEKRHSDVQMTTDDADVTFHEEQTIRLNPTQVQELTVESTAVKTSSSNKHLKEELKKVYKPQPVDQLVQHGDEDRMPTIVFDDEMAKNLEENRKLLTPQQPQQPQEKPDDDNGDITSIKISH